MKKKALLIVAILSLFAAVMTSCTKEDVDAFESGFQAGWNSTAPSEYWI